MNPTQENDKLKTQKRDAQQSLKKKITSDQKKKGTFQKGAAQWEKNQREESIPHMW